VESDPGEERRQVGRPIGKVGIFVNAQSGADAEKSESERFACKMGKKSKRGSAKPGCGSQVGQRREGNGSPTGGKEGGKCVSLGGG